MNQLERHLAASLYRGILLALLILVLLFSFGALVKEFDDVGQGSYDAGKAMFFVLLTMPRRALELLPVCTLLGALFGLGGLAAAGELVAMRALGFSRPRIARGLIVAVLPLVLIIGATAEWIAPGFERAARSNRTAALTGTATVETASGFWFKDGANRVRIGSIRPDGMPAEILIFELDGKHLSRFIKAERSERQADGTWTLVEVSERKFSDRGLFLNRYDRLPWETSLSGPELELLPQAPESLAPSTLIEQIRTRALRGQDQAAHELALWRLAARPLSMLGMLLLALPFVFGGLRDASLGRRVLLGALLGVLSYVFEQGAGHLGIIVGLEPAITAMAPPLIIAALGLGLYAFRR